MKKPAFTLVEILVTIAITMLVGSFGFINYFNFQERQQVENTAKEVISFLREIQSNARNGSRGTGACDQSIQVIAAGNSQLLNWTTTFKGGNVIDGAPTCNNRAPSSAYAEVKGNAQEFRLPKGLTIRPDDGATITYVAPFGNTIYRNQAGKELRQGMITIDNGKNYYKFYISRGAFTNGCFCEDATCTTPGEC